MQKIFKDAGLSVATAKRSALLRCLKTLQTGDTFTGMEARPARPQPARSDNPLGGLQACGVKFHSLTEAIDTTTPTGRANIARLAGRTEDSIRDGLVTAGAPVVLKSDVLEKTKPYRPFTPATL